MNFQLNAARIIYSKLRVNYHPDEPAESYDTLTPEQRGELSKQIELLFDGPEDVFECCQIAMDEFFKERKK